MLNILQIPNKFYLAECFIQTSGNSMNQIIGTSVPENWRRKMGGGGRGGGNGGRSHVTYQEGGTFEWGGRYA